MKGMKNFSQDSQCPGFEAGTFQTRRSTHHPTACSVNFSSMSYHHYSSFHIFMERMDYLNYKLQQHTC
jgi:hypothetical protein